MSLTAADCNENGVDDIDDLVSGASRDCDNDLVPDECVGIEGRLQFTRSEPLAGWGHSMVVRDFDADGDVDFATAGALGVTIVLNAGDGRAASEAWFEVPDFHWNLVTGDIDGDGDDDLVAVDSNTPDVLTLRNDGTGTFDMSKESYPVAGVQRPVLIDRDGDGDLDLIGISGRTRIVSYDGRGDGTFDEVLLAELDFQARTLDIADLDGVGSVDLIVTEFMNTDPDSIGIIYGDASDVYSDVVRVTTDLLSGGVAVAELDGQPGLDLAVANFRAHSVSLLFNRGDGTFDSAIQLPASRWGMLVAAADLDGDGDQDLVSAGSGIQSSPLDICVLRNDGDRVFRDAGCHTYVSTASNISLADFSGDGLTDIVVTRDFGGDAIVLQNLGDATFEDVGVFGFGASRSVDLAVEDVDGDGDRDLISAHLGGWDPANLGEGKSIAILRNSTGDDVRPTCTSFVRGDLNADGAVSVADLVTLRRHLFSPGGALGCRDSADLSDDETLNLCDALVLLRALYLTENWTFEVPAPWGSPGLDPTYAAQTGLFTFCGDVESSIYDTLGCDAYEPVLPSTSGDVLRIGDVTAEPGDEVEIPVYLSASGPVAAVQIVLAHDPEVLEITGVHHEGTFYDVFDDPGRDDEIDRPALSILSEHSSYGVVTIAIAGDFIDDGYEIAAGDDVLVAWIEGRVPAGAAAGTFSILPTDGPDGEGVGPLGLRNEISTSRGDAVLVSALPTVIPGIFEIIADQSFFRGDANLDGGLDVSDASVTLRALFLAGGALPCEDAADANDDGRLDISDPIRMLEYLFLSGDELPLPRFPEPGADPTADDLHCTGRSGS